MKVVLVKNSRIKHRLSRSCDQVKKEKQQQDWKYNRQQQKRDLDQQIQFNKFSLLKNIFSTPKSRSL